MSGKVVRNQLKHKLVGTASGKTYDWASTKFIKSTVLPAKGDSDVMLCLQSYQDL